MQPEETLRNTSKIQKMSTYKLFCWYENIDDYLEEAEVQHNVLHWKEVRSLISIEMRTRLKQDNYNVTR